MQIYSALTSVIALLGATSLGGSRPLAQPAGAPVPTAGAAVDSLRTLRAARRAQEQFESVRRANLPFGLGAPRGACDVQLGRLCYWHDDGAPPTEVPEPERIALARERLLAVLENAGRQVRGDDWIAGQRVRYLIDARRDRDAVDAAASCEAAAWWCAALSGLALHRAQEYAAADSAFAAALAAMPAKQRCDWTDISILLEGAAAGRYERLSCQERTALEERFWWLSKPLYSIPGNDARTEFFARRTMSRLEQQARSAYNMSWGWDVEALLMRYGWPTWWTRDHPSGVSASPGPPSIVGHEPTPSFYFHPAMRLLEASVGDARADDWQPRMKLPPARYAPAYAAGFADLQAQVSVFRRADTAVVVAGYEHPTDSLFDGAAPDAALVVASDGSSPPIVIRGDSSRGRNVLVAKAPWTPMLVSVELTAPRTRGVARSRFGIRPTESVKRERLALSDLLLYRTADNVGGTLDDVLPRALGSNQLVAGEGVGVYWELYGVRPAGEQLFITLTVERVGASWTTRAAERLGLVGKVTPLRVRWPEVPKRDAGFASRAIRIDLSSLQPSRYRMELTVVAEDGGTARAQRFIELVRAR